MKWSSSAAAGAGSTVEQVLFQSSISRLTTGLSYHWSMDDVSAWYCHSMCPLPCSNHHLLAACQDCWSAALSLLAAVLFLYLILALPPNKLSRLTLLVCCRLIKCDFDRWRLIQDSVKGDCFHQSYSNNDWCFISCETCSHSCTTVAACRNSLPYQS